MDTGIEPFPGVRQGDAAVSNEEFDNEFICGVVGVHEALPLRRDDFSERSGDSGFCANSHAFTRTEM